MIPVNQTIFGPQGNCFAACIASILEVPLKEVPECNGGRFSQALMDWLRERGLGLVSTPTRGAFIYGYCILVARSQRTDGFHCVVLEDGDVVHDPHPGRALGIGEWTTLYAFYHLNPAAVRALHAEVERLRAAIAKHRSQKADDRCIEDDDELYAALGDGIKCDRRVGDKIAMLHNCERFITRRCEGGGWLSYVELEAERDEAREGIRAAHRVLDELGVKREDEFCEGGVCMVTEYPVCDRIRLAVEKARAVVEPEEHF